MTSPNALDESGPGRAVRLIFEYDGDDVRLVSQQLVDVAVTGSDIASGPRSGNYVEMRTDAGEVLVRAPIRDAFAASAEVFPEQPGEPITRVDVERPRGAFTVVVPAPDTAQRVAVIRVSPTPPGVPRIDAGTTSPMPGEPEVVELASFALEVGD